MTDPRKAHRGPVYIQLPAVFLIPLTAVQGVPLCAALQDPLVSNMARLALPVFLILCLSLLHLSSSQPPRIRKAVSARPSGNYAYNIELKNNVFAADVYLIFLFLLLSVEMQLQWTMMWSLSWRGCGRRWIHWKRCRRCRQVPRSMNKDKLELLQSDYLLNIINTFGRVYCYFCSEMYCSLQDFELFGLSSHQQREASLLSSVKLYK